MKRLTNEIITNIKKANLGRRFIMYTPVYNILAL